MVDDWIANNSNFPFVSNVTEEFDPYCRKSPVECHKLQLLGVFCICVAVGGVFFNSLLLYVTLRHKDMRSSLNALMIALSVVNLFGSLVEMPFIIISNLKCKWVFGKFGCDISSVFMFFIGCTSIHLMAVISLQRYYIIQKPLNIRKISLLKTLHAISLSTLVGFLWSIMPVIGWSHYELEGAYTSCSIAWRNPSFVSKSINICIFIFVFLIPMGTIVVTNIKLLIKVFNLPKFIKTVPTVDKKKLIQLNNERKLTINVFFFITGFVVAWCPYAITCMYFALGGQGDIDPIFGTSLALFAKSSMLWTPVLFIFSNRNILKKLNICQNNDAKSNITIESEHGAQLNKMNKKY